MHRATLAPATFVSSVFIIAFVALYLITRPILDDFDMGWHLAAGEWILAHGRLPTQDPWSFTSGAARWQNLSWLWDLGIAWIGKKQGLGTLYLLTVTLLSFLTALVAHHLSRRDGVDTQSMAIVLVILLLSLWPCAFPRPQLFTYLMAGVFHYVCYKSRRDGKGIKSLMPLPFFMILWVNMHGGFIVGFTIFGAYSLEALARKEWRRLIQLEVICILCALALLLNPYGLSIFSLMWETMHGSAITPYISEWEPFSFKTHMAFSLLVILLVLTSNFRMERIPLADKILTGAWLIMALLSVRHFPIFAIVSAPYVTMCLRDMLTSRPHLDGHASEEPSRILAAIAVALPIAALMFPVSTWLHKDLVMPDNKIPIKALDALKRTGVHNVLNDYNLGGYMIYFNRVSLHPFVDGRAMSAYPESVLKDYIRFVKVDKDWESILKTYPIEGILVGDKHIFQVMYDHGAYRKQWKEIYHDDLASAYVRR